MFQYMKEGSTVPRDKEQLLDNALRAHKEGACHEVIRKTLKDPLDVDWFREHATKCGDCKREAVA